MEPSRILWATQAYKLDSLPVSSQRLVNYYAEKEPPDAKTQVAVLGAPGILPFATVGAVGIRGFNAMNGICYVVAGSNLYSLTASGATALLGTGISGVFPVRMDNNGYQVIIVNGDNGWIYAPSATGTASSATVAFGGVDYSVGETVTIAGGTYSSPVVLVVLTVNGSGAIETVAVQNGGQYTQEPANPAGQSAASDGGTGATFNIVFTGPAVGFSEITDPNFFPANTVIFYDEYFVKDRAGTNLFDYSDLLNGMSWPALNFEAAEVQSDFVVAVLNQQENLLIFGAKSIETWYDAGTFPNPFARYDGATIERGCAAALTVLKEDNSVFFLGDDKVFYRLDGVLLHRISTHAIESAWQAYSSVSDAFAFSYTFNGHKFVSVTFISGNATWVYDIASGFWHERVSYVATMPFTGKWRGQCAVEFAGRVLIGDALSGEIGYLSDSTYIEFGQPMIGLISSPPVHKDRKRVFGGKLEINMEVGTGVTTGQGSDPQVMLEISKNAGKTWGTRQLWHSMGREGAYDTRLLWKKLGKARDWRFRCIISDPVPRRFIDSYFTAEPEEV